MLEKDFQAVLPYIAVGVTGQGSENYGFDDEISRDHDFEPGFCIFLPGEDIVDRKTAFLLERAYAKALPKEYQGVKRLNMSPVGGNRHGVFRTQDFYKGFFSSDDFTLSDYEWITIPDFALAEITNGEIFMDNYGEVTKIRDYLSDIPRDPWLKRIAGNMLIMAQSGQYNYARCIAHGEPEAAMLAVCEFVNAAIKTYFLLNHKFAPYYKWSFRALRLLSGGENFSELLSKLLSGSSDDKEETIEAVSDIVVNLLKKESLVDISGNNLEECAYQINDKIKDNKIRNLSIFTAC